MRLFTTIFFLIVCLVSLQAQKLKVSTNEKGKCGFVNEQGQPVTAYQYDLAFPFFDGAAKVGKG
ncbi:MAG: WG repeat-containing protein, partial [Alloprevotella sp.]|nr:WG repeat-containing protein [Alloprevotella sp.]